MDDDRPVTRAEEMFFNECGTGHGLDSKDFRVIIVLILLTVPVILIFTKFDGFVDRVFGELTENIFHAEVASMAQQKAEKDFEKLYVELGFKKYKYPPKTHLCLQGNNYIVSSKLI